jgi:hypothetical protein
MECQSSRRRVGLEDGGQGGDDQLHVRLIV